MDKIDSIRESLNHHPVYVPTRGEVQSFGSFCPMSADEILKIIMDILVKLCDRDPIPDSVFKELARYILPEITYLVNISLTHGLFADE